MFWDVYHEGRFLERVQTRRRTTAIHQAARRFRLPAWELEGRAVEG